MEPASTHRDGLVSPEAFREALRALPSGVVVVTAWLDGRPWGLTVSACCSVSAAPPRVLVSLHRETTSRALICEHGTFGVSVLGSEHKGVAELASRPSAPKFVDEHCTATEGLSPRIAGALAHLDCRVQRTFDVSDHTLVIGDVASTSTAADGEPLIYFDRAYRRLGAAL